jgi:hypothetical protein
MGTRNPQAATHKPQLASGASPAITAGSCVMDAWDEPGWCWCCPSRVSTEVVYCGIKGKCLKVPT